MTKKSLGGHATITALKSRNGHVKGTACTAIFASSVISKVVLFFTYRERRSLRICPTSRTDLRRNDWFKITLDTCLVSC